MRRGGVEEDPAVPQDTEGLQLHGGTGIPDSGLLRERQKQGAGSGTFNPCPLALGVWRRGRWSKSPFHDVVEKGWCGGGGYFLGQDYSPEGGEGSWRLPWLMREPRRSPRGGGTCGRRERAWTRLLPPQDRHRPRTGRPTQEPAPVPEGSSTPPGRLHRLSPATRAGAPARHPVANAGFLPLAGFSAALPLPPGRSVLQGQDPGSTSLASVGPLGGESPSTRGSFPKMGRGQSRGSRSQERRRCPGSKKELGLHGTHGSEARRCPEDVRAADVQSTEPEDRGTDGLPAHGQAAALLGKPAGWAGEAGAWPQPAASTGHRGAGRLGLPGSWGSFWDRGFAHWTHSRVTGEMGEGRPSLCGLFRSDQRPACLQPPPPTPSFRSGSWHPGMGTIVRRGRG